MVAIQLPSQKSIPRIGLGTWYMGEDKSLRKQEIHALRFGIEYGAKLIDTAEMYGEAELITGEAIRGYRDNVYLVSKFYPHLAGRQQVIAACERSLRRLNTDHLDLYLLHWRIALSTKVTCFSMLCCTNDRSCCSLTDALNFL